MKPEAHLPVAAYAAEHPVLQNPGETRMLDHLPQLDGLRAVAVSLVLWAHFAPDAYRFNGNPPWGAVGVGIFFVLSGFLITRILLNCRLKITDGRATFWSSFKQFYIRRFLRIFPLYYGVLTVLFVLNVPGFRKRAAYSFLYLTNYRFSYDAPVYAERWLRRMFMHMNSKQLNAIHWTKVPPAIERHLWSLSVEEQFYIFWPIVVLLCPRKLLMPMIILTIAIGPLWRWWVYVPRLQKHEWMTPGCLDLLAAGALLALLSLPRFGWSHYRDGFVQLCGLIGVPMLIAYMAQRWYPTAVHKGTIYATGYDWLDYGGAVYPITALVGVWLIGMAARGFRGPLGWLLTCPPVVYLGRISYGVYVLHLMMPAALLYLFPSIFAPHGEKGPRMWWHLWTYTAVSIALASLSWFLYEAPINRLKRYFEYDKAAAAKAAANASTPAVSA